MKRYHVLENRIKKVLKNRTKKEVLSFIDNRLNDIKKRNNENHVYYNGFHDREIKNLTVLNMILCIINIHGDIFKDYQGTFTKCNDLNIINGMNITKWTEEKHYTISFYTKSVDDIKIIINDFDYNQLINYTVIS